MHIEPTKSYDAMIRNCFEEDAELLSKWHIAAGSGLNGCVARTLEDLKRADPSFTMYELKNDKELVGFFGVEKAYNANFLTSFFIRPKYRNKDTIVEFWNKVNECFEGTYLSGIYMKNTPAAKFLEKAGGKAITFVTIEGNPAVVYRLKGK